ncbi:MAG: helix-turn-helix transcriptional regulator [Bacteroidia bacterium]|nr:helix-turn-helix transcriptional regulator [Bacteroidia bacterium]
MKTRLRTNNPRLLQLFDRHALAFLNKQPDGDSFANRVNKILVDQLREDSPGIEFVADHFSMSVRSLQMKLKAEGTSYQKLLNNIRKDLAIAYLQERKVSKGEIAHLLGFSEISVFSRTFKKWTGKSPSEFQAEIVYA